MGEKIEIGKKTFSSVEKYDLIAVSTRSYNSLLSFPSLAPILTLRAANGMQGTVVPGNITSYLVEIIRLRIPKFINLIN